MHFAGRRSVSRRLSLRPAPHSVTRPGTIIVNADAHSGSHWLATHFQPASYTAFYMDFLGLSLRAPTYWPFWDATALLSITTECDCRASTATRVANIVLSSLSTWTENTRTTTYPSYYWWRRRAGPPPVPLGIRTRTTYTSWRWT